MKVQRWKECARLHVCCMGLDKVEPWIIFTWQKQWINHNWLLLSHELVLATRLDLQIAAEMDNGAVLWWWLASLTSWNGPHHGRQTNSLSQLTDPLMQCHTCWAMCWMGCTSHISGHDNTTHKHTHTQHTHTHIHTHTHTHTYTHTQT